MTTRKVHGLISTYERGCRCNACKKEHRRTAQKIYCEANKVKKAEQARKWRQIPEVKAHRAKSHKAWLTANSESSKAYHKAYRETNKERITAWKRTDYYANREEREEGRREYQR